MATPSDSAGGLTPVAGAPPPPPAMLPAIPQWNAQLLSALTAQPAEEPPSIDFGAFGRTLRRFWLLPLLTIGLCLGAAFYWLDRTPVLYLALAEIEVGQERSELLPTAGEKGEDLKSLEMLKSIERQIAGQNVLLEVARRFKLHHDPVMAGAKSTPGLNDDEVVVALAKRVTASLERGTRNIVVSVEDTDPKRARDICQTLIDFVVQRDPGTTAALKEKAVTALEKQSQEARTRMESAQAAVNAFRKKHPSLPLEETPSDMKTNSMEDRLKVLNTDAVKAADEVSATEAIVDRLSSAGSNINALLAVPGLATSEAVTAQRKALAEAQVKLAESDYGPKHPVYRAMQQQIGEIALSLQQTLLTAAKAERSKWERAKANQQRIEKEIAALKSSQLNFAAVAGEFQQLARELKAAQTSYSTVLTRMNEEKTNSAVGSSALRVVADPLTPTDAWKPRRKIVLGAAGAAGLLGGLGLIALLMLTDRTIRSLSAGERILKLPGFAALPKVKFPGSGVPLVYDKTEDSPSAESFRSLRAALTNAGHNGAARSVLFTSTVRGEGTSYAALNCAASLAQQGYRTLILDANLRSPAMDQALFGSRSATGLADYLSGEFGEDAKLCQPTEHANLFIFAAGYPKSHPAEVLNEASFARLLQESLKWFHRVIIDTPAAGQYADALPLARHCDAVCLVVKAGTSSRGHVLKTISRLTAAGARPAGFVLNAAPGEAVRESFAGEIAAPFRAPASLPALPPPTGA